MSFKCKMNQCYEILDLRMTYVCEKQTSMLSTDSKI